MALGHEVRLIPARYVKPYVKANKNDAADAAAICEAVTRPTIMRRQFPISPGCGGTNETAQAAYLDGH